MPGAGEEVGAQAERVHLQGRSAGAPQEQGRVEGVRDV